MTAKETYAERLKSKAWIAFSKRLRSLANNQCSMCGRSGTETHCHHMRYYSKDSEKEWMDITVLCAPCHNEYHRVTPKMPKRKLARWTLCCELSDVLRSSGICVSHFETHGAKLNAEWIANQVLMGKSEVNRPRRERKPKRASPPQIPAPINRPVWQGSWQPEPSLFTDGQASAFLCNPGSSAFGGDKWLAKFQIPNPPPKKWRKRLKFALKLHFRKNHLG